MRACDLRAAGVGEAGDHRVPELTLLRAPSEPRWQPSAAVGVEALWWREPAWKPLQRPAVIELGSVELAGRSDRDSPRHPRA